MTGAEYANALRQLADFYEAHPNLPAPETYFAIYVPTEKFTEVAQALGSFKKTATDTFFNLVKEVGPWKIEFFNYRDRVCQKVVTGKKLVPETVIPAQAEKVIPAHEEEIIEFVCPESLLSPEPSREPGEPMGLVGESDIPWSSVEGAPK